MNENIKIELNKDKFSTIKVHLPSSEIDELIVDDLKQLSKTMSMKGFRPGKVPIEVVEKLAKEEVTKNILLKKGGDAINKYFENNSELLLFSPPFFINASLIENQYVLSLISDIIEKPKKINIDKSCVIEISREEPFEGSSEEMLVKFAAKNTKFLESIECIETNSLIVVEEINGIKISNHLFLLLDEKKPSINDFYGKKSGDLIKISLSEYENLKDLLYKVEELSSVNEWDHIECKISKVFKVCEDKVSVDDIINAYQIDLSLFSDEDISTPQNLILAIHRLRQKEVYNTRIEREIIEAINKKTEIFLYTEIGSRFLNSRSRNLFNINYENEEEHSEELIQEVMSTLCFSVFASDLVKELNLSIDPEKFRNISTNVVMNNYNAYLQFCQPNTKPLSINDFFSKHRDLINDDIRIATQRYMAIEYIKANAELKTL